MNEKFFNLAEEKRQRIINAGYRVFSRNSYKKVRLEKLRQRREFGRQGMIRKGGNRLWKTLS